MRTTLAISILAVAALVFFGDVIFTDRVLLTANPASYHPWSAYATEEGLGGRNYRTDSILTYLPRQAELRRGIASGRLPLWNPYILTGSPFFADPQSRVLYPVSLALTAFDPEKAMGYDVALHFFLAMLGMYLFLRAVSASTLGSLLGAFAYGFSSFFFTRMGHPTFVASAAWIPYFFYGFETARSGGRMATLMLAAFLAMGYLAGFPQVFMFGVAGLAIYACYLAVDEKPRGPREIVARGILAARTIGVAGIVCGLVVCVHLVPFVELLRNSVGLGIPYGTMAQSLLSKPVLMLRLVFPNLFGNPVEGTNWLPLVQQVVHPNNLGLMVYCGSGALLAALGGLAFIRHSRHVRALFLLLLVSIAVGVSGPVLKAAYAVMPLVGYSQIDRISVLACFALAALAGVGFSLFTSANDRTTKLLFLGVVAVAVGVALAGSLIFLLRGDGIISCVPGGSANLGTSLPLQGAEKIRDWVAGDGSAWVAYERRQVSGGLVFTLVSLGLVAACALSHRRKKIGTVIGLLFLGWMVAEVGFVARNYYVSQQAPGIFRTDGITALLENAGDPPVWRVAGEESSYPVLPPNTNQIFGLQSLGGRATIMPRAYAYLANAGRGSGPRPEAPAAERLAPGSDIAGFMSVRYVLESGYNPNLAASPIVEAIAASGGSIRVLSLGGEARVALRQSIGEPTAVGLMIPSARRLDFSAGLPEAYPDIDSVVVLVRCAVGSRTAETIVRADAAAWGGRWHRGSLDISSLGAGYGRLTLAARAVGLSGKSRAGAELPVIAWSGMEFVFADCPARQIERGYVIQLAGRSPQGSPAKSPAEVLSLDVASSAREVVFEIRSGSQSMARRLVFGSNLSGRTLLVGIADGAPREVTVVSDSAYSLNSCKTAYYPRASEHPCDLVYSGDMYVFENGAATARAVCLDRSRIELGDSQGTRILPAAGLAGRTSDLGCGEARIVSYEPERIEVRVSADRDCYLLFQDAYYPGWRAYVDGRETEVFMTDVGTRALEVASGNHMVVMKFKPSSLWVGLVLSCLGLVLGILYAAKGRLSARV